MDHEKKESSGIKTHEEIMALFNDLETLEQQIKNPEATLADEPIKSKVNLQEVQLPTQKSPTTREQPQDLQPASEIPYTKKKRQKDLLFKKQEKEYEPTKKATKRFAFLKGKKKIDLEPEMATELLPQIQVVKPVRSTFTLELDSNGNLIGLPVKKPKSENEKKGWSIFKRKNQEETMEHPEEEDAKGIKGVFKRIGSKLRRNKSSEGESSEGIGAKIKGIFRRNSKE